MTLCPDVVRGDRVADALCHLAGQTARVFAREITKKPHEGGFLQTGSGRGAYESSIG
jgi:hypothetical protein